MSCRVCSVFTVITTCTDETDKMSGNVKKIDETDKMSGNVKKMELHDYAMCIRVASTEGKTYFDTFTEGKDSSLFGRHRSKSEGELSKLKETDKTIKEAINQRIQQLEAEEAIRERIQLLKTEKDIRKKFEKPKTGNHAEDEAIRQGIKHPETGAPIDKLLALLRKVKWPSTVQGMSVKDNKLCFDIIEGNTGSFRAFLLENCSEIFFKFNIDQHNSIVVREMPAPFEFQVSSGDTVGIANEVMRIAVEQGHVLAPGLHEIENQSFGTVGLIAKDASTGGLFLITARHVFNEPGEGFDSVLDPEEGLLRTVICSQENRIVHAGERSYGVLGGYGDEAKFVDISVVPLDAVESWSDQSAPDLLDAYIPTIPQEELQVYTVTANGAVVANAVGEIIDFNYSPIIDGQMFSDCLLIKPNAPFLQFSLKGDSGAVVTGVLGGTEYILGLVCRGPGNLHDTATKTVVVKLHNCLNAIKEHFNLDLKVSETWRNCQIRW